MDVATMDEWMPDWVVRWATDKYEWAKFIALVCLIAPVFRALRWTPERMGSLWLALAVASVAVFLHRVTLNDRYQARLRTLEELRSNTRLPLKFLYALPFLIEELAFLARVLGPAGLPYLRNAAEQLDAVCEIILLRLHVEEGFDEDIEQDNAIVYARRALNHLMRADFRTDAVYTRVALFDTIQRLEARFAEILPGFAAVGPLPRPATSSILASEDGRVFYEEVSRTRP